MMKKSLLLVDDEPAILDSLSTYMERYFTVYRAVNGQEAWEILLRGQVDCLVTDINMPVMNGFELIKKMSDAHCTTPTIAVSGGDSEWLGKKCDTLGLDGYLPKPYSLEELLAMVRAMVEE